MSGILKDMSTTFWQGVRGQTILGGDDFTEWVRERFLSNITGDKRELPGLRALGKGAGTIRDCTGSCRVIWS